MNPEQLSPIGKKFLQHIEFDSDERLHLEVRKHPVGLIMIYLAGFTASIVLFGFLVLGAASVDLGSFGNDVGVSGSVLQASLIALGFFMTIFAIIITAVAAYIYNHNVLLITSEKVAQQLYLSLFNKKISQISIADVQDTTVRQDGILSHIFNYGTVTIETAGEQENYKFTFAPNPYEVSKALTGSHEADVAQHGN